MSSRTLGTSAKKKRAKNPATPPKPAARVPLCYISVCSEEDTDMGDNVRLDKVASSNAVEVALDGVSAVGVSWMIESVFSPLSTAPVLRSLDVYSPLPRVSSMEYLLRLAIVLLSTDPFLLFILVAASGPPLPAILQTHPNFSKRNIVYVLRAERTPVSLVGAALALSGNQLRSLRHGFAAFEAP